MAVKPMAGTFHHVPVQAETGRRGPSSIRLNQQGGERTGQLTKSANSKFEQLGGEGGGKSGSVSKTSGAVKLLDPKGKGYVAGGRSLSKA